MRRSTIKVLVVDDSALIRQMLTRALALDPRIEVVGVGKTGVEAIEKARELRPDVITLDIEMPELTGLEALPHLAKCCSARVIMLSSLDDPDTTYAALSRGAVDFIPKPSGMASSIEELSEVLVKKIKTAYRVDPAKLASQREGSESATLSAKSPPADRRVARATARRGIASVVAIAASTGGPPALERLFTGLDPEAPVSYLVVQHLPAGFGGSLARRLTNVSGIEVAEATDGECISAGRGYLAPHGSHMTIDTAADGSLCIKLNEGPPLHGVKPAADPLFDSVAERFGESAIGVVLTGMGSDGARGMRSIVEHGGDTIAQDERTSVVWGMPGAAHRIGAVRHLVPIGLMAIEVRRLLKARGVGRG